MKFVFCEGDDDVAVVKGLVKHLKLEITVEKYGGKDNLPNFLDSLPKRPEFAQQLVDTMAIIRDADGDSKSAFASVCNSLRRYEFAAPENNKQLSNSPLRVGVFIVGIGGRGMIEDVCLDSVSNQSGFNCVEAYFNCIAQNSERKEFSSKAKIRVWMASQVDHEYYVGKAATHGYWNWERPAFDSLRKFLKEL